MSDAVPPPEAPTPPLNLPVGSVRALLTLSVLGTVWALMLQGRAVGPEMEDTLLLVLGYYFGARAVGARADAFTVAADREGNAADPLYLPRGAIRLLIVVGFVAVAVQLHQQGKLLTKPPPLLVLAGMFIVGAGARGLALWVGHLLTTRLQSALGHLAATLTLLVVFAWCGVELAGAQARVPTWAPNAFLAVIGFYLGKR